MLEPLPFCVKGGQTGGQTLQSNQRPGTMKAVQKARGPGPRNKKRKGEPDMKKAWTALLLTVTLSLGLAAPAAAARFSDVPASYWGYEGIEYVTDKGLFSGATATTFAPESSMSRSMLVQVLYSYAGKPAMSGSIAADTAFTDIPKGAYYEDAVLWALEENILPMWFYLDSRNQNDWSQDFQPNKVVNRAEFCLMLYAFYENVLGLEYDMDEAGLKQDYLSGSQGAFQDMTLAQLTQAFQVLAPYSKNHDVEQEILFAMLGWAQPEGIMTGTNANVMSPDLGVTRAQVATMLMQFHRSYGGFVQPEPEPEPEPEPDPGSGEEAFLTEVIRLVNVERAKEGLSALKTNDAITEAAQTRADELLQLFDHTRPDGRSCFTALGEAGVSYRAAGENIAMGYPTPEAVVNGWMNSPGHRANILNRSFTTIGVGYNSQRNCWVQMFVG